MIQGFRSQAEEKHITLGHEVTPISLTINADPRQVKRILSDLVDNAIKFTPAGGHVSVIAKFAQNAVSPDLSGLDSPIVIRVRDTGIGIKPKDMERVFAGQVDAARTRSYEGTGMGLMLARQLVELLGGRIWFESEGVPGRGTTFSVAMPG